MEKEQIVALVENTARATAAGLVANASETRNEFKIETKKDADGTWSYVLKEGSTTHGQKTGFPSEQDALMTARGIADRMHKNNKQFSRK